MAHSTAPQLFSTTGRPETLACGNHCDCTLTEPALRATLYSIGHRTATSAPGAVRARVERASNFSSVL